MLHYVDYAGPGTVPVVISHGLFGSARNWNVIAKRLSAGRRVVAVDMRNHGGSFWDDDHSYAALAADLAEVILALGGRAVVLGHSMGGKAAMVLAVRRPELVAGLVVADIAPVAYEHTQLPMIDAMHAVDLSRVGRRAEADAQLAAHIPEAPLRAFLLQSLDLSDGAVRWRLNLDALASGMEAIIGFPALTGRYAGPTLFVTGGASDYVRPQHRTLISALFPATAFQVIPDMGHWLHAEAPAAFLTAVEDWLDRKEQSES